MLNEINDENTVEEVTAPINNGDDTSATEAPSGNKKEIIDYLNPNLFNEVKTISINELDVKLDAEVDLVDKEKAYKNTLVDISEHELINGRVVGMNDRDVLIDIGFKSEGIIDRSEFTDEDLPSIGDQVEVYLEYLEDSSGNTILSKEKADFMLRWKSLREAFENEKVITGKIIRRIKGVWSWI